MTEQPFSTCEHFPMSSAPRNGLSIIVGDPDCGEFVMHWNPTGTNPLFQRGMGIWEATEGGFTWSEEGGAGPKYWYPLADEKPWGEGQ